MGTKKEGIYPNVPHTSKVVVPSRLPLVSIEAFSKSSSLRGRLARAGSKKALEKRTPTSSKDKMIDPLPLLIGNDIVVVVTITLLPLQHLQNTLEKGHEFSLDGFMGDKHD